MDVRPINYKAGNIHVLLADAFKNIGFALLTNHSINSEPIAENLRDWQNFFASHYKFQF
jgi:isopenicillin N synthase-like dioxygenase